MKLFILLCIAGVFFKPSALFVCMPLDWSTRMLLLLPLIAALVTCVSIIAATLMSLFRLDKYQRVNNFGKGNSREV